MYNKLVKTTSSFVPLDLFAEMQEMRQVACEAFVVVLMYKRVCQIVHNGFLRSLYLDAQVDASQVNRGQ